MAYGVNGPCYTCKYLTYDNGKPYCEWLKSYIKPDSDGCGHHSEK